MASARCPPNRSEPAADDAALTDIATISVLPDSGPATRRACLIVLSGQDAGQIVPLEARETVIGRAKHAELRLNGEGISRRHALVVRRGDDFVIQDLGSSNGTRVNGELVEEIVLRDQDRIRFGAGTLLLFSVHDAPNEQFKTNLLAAAQRDGLTSTYNKLYLTEALQLEVAFAARDHKALAVLMLDLDHFKRINDGIGRLAGDTALAQVGRLLAQSIRKDDILARVDGEKFVIVCRGHDEATASRFAERVRRLIELGHFEHKSMRLTLTVSIGIAVLSEDAATPEAMLAAADAALRTAKGLGRNRVICHSRLLSDGINAVPTLRVPKIKG